MNGKKNTKRAVDVGEDASLQRLAIVASVIAAACVVGALASCATLDAMTGVSGDVEAAGTTTVADRITAVASGFHPGAGGILAMLFGAYSLIRKRSRRGWAGALKALLPMPGDPSIRLGDALRSVDQALGGGHTSAQGGGAP